MSQNTRILVIEDDKDISEVLKLQLQLQNYTPIITGSLYEAKNYFDDSSIHLFLIDRMLPDSSGLEICKYLRSNSIHAKTPIILITAMAEAQNIIEGLDAGANDYITKPFDINILQARVRAQLRTNDKESKVNCFRIGPLSLDQDKCEVKYHQKPIHLTNTEFQILFQLFQRPGIVYSRKKLINSVLGNQVHVTNRTIDTHIAGLRKKLGDASNLIETIRGVGYRLKENE
ncbi:MAG: response regulator transcription factor [Bacteriovoracaceae bacterium]|jgi:DNA-binding response OmpR family regulator|nr:response regulator transcription factor [Bacteriovoracaceae bacterium]